MGKEIRLILSSITNSLNSNGYYNVVTPTKRLGQIMKDTNHKRSKSSRRLAKVTDARIRELSSVY